jgi:mediator of RNA polymerase II transcription subunit 13
MDFLKACTTNIHVVDNLTETAFSLYKLKDGGAGDAQRLKEARDAATHLRHERVLCAIVGQDICIFGDDVDAEHFLNLEEKYDLVDEGALGSQSEIGLQNAQNTFLDAIEHAIAFSLAREAAVTHIALWTWLYYDSKASDGDLGSVIKMHVRYTIIGSLLLVPQIIPASWLPINHLSYQIHTNIILTPHGVHARAVPETGSKMRSDNAWKANVSEALRSSGIDIAPNEAWIAVELQDSTESGCLWPERLCLAPVTTTMADDLSVERQDDWRHWLAGSDEEHTFRNPVTVAEEWFKGASAREQAAQSELAAASISNPGNGLDASIASASTTANDASNTTSPPFMQRAIDQQLAMSGIYPTPPDGMTQVPQTTQINMAATPSVTQADNTVFGTELMPSTSGESQLNTADPTQQGNQQQEYQLDQEDLFGDVAGAMEFGEDQAVDDADFNFFDEPDDGPDASNAGDMDMDGEAVPGQETAPHIEDTTDESQSVVLDALDSALEHSTTVDEAAVPALNDKDRDCSDAAEQFEPQSELQAPKPEKALSPFGIKERLFPPPVPASLANTEAQDFAKPRRRSTFAPIVFKESFNLGSKYVGTDLAGEEARASTHKPNVPDISLPPIKKKSRLLRKRAETTAGSNTESEEDSYESASSESDNDVPPRLPWDTRKRKRLPRGDDLQPLSGSLERMWSDDDPDDDVGTTEPQHDMASILEQCLTTPQDGDGLFSATRSCAKVHWTRSSAYDGANEGFIESIRDIEDLHNLRKEDMIFVAQIVNEQSMSAIWPEATLRGASPENDTIESSHAQSLQASIAKAVEGIFPEVETCDLGRLAAIRDSGARPSAIPAKTPQGQPRMPQRGDSQITVGPDCFVLPSPYVRLQRGSENWEMLPACLSFWETLGLGPASGPKNVRAFCVFPSNDDLQHVIEQFMGDLGTSYESCKLGSHIHSRNVTDTKTDSFENGMAPVKTNDEDESVEGLLKAYATTCRELGKALSTFGHLESDRTIVVYMFNPFPGRQALQHLCACFWALFKAYRDNVPKAHRNQCASDIVLQVLPIDLVASLDGIVVPESRQMAIVAREVYDRCPPASTHAAETLSALPILAAPSVELANSAPKRIGFQLAAEPPNDLLHEGSVLHVAYACSQDGQWLTVAWIDNTGQHQLGACFCLRGRTFVDVAEDVWERTCEILTARQVTWRVFIVTPDPMYGPLSQCWRTISSRRRPQPICVTSLSVQLDPVIHLSPPVPPSDSEITWPGSDAGFLTPATTPQASTMTSSPNMSNDPTAPPTPAPSETATAIAENDPDAHLTDLTDETWGLIISPKLFHIASAYPGQANGVLYRRGDPSPGEPLSSLVVSVHWTIQVKPSGGVDDGSGKQAELTLREVLKMYRNLALLTKARGLEGGRTKFAPVHVAMVVRGVEGLEGMLETGGRSEL